MIKALTTGGVVIFALEHGNIDRLRENDPIVVNMAEVSYPDAGLTVITWMSPEGRYAMPPRPMQNDVQRTIALTDEAIEALARMPAGEYVGDDMDGIEIRLMIGDIGEIEQEMRKNWTPNTIVTRTGRSPTDAPPSNN